MTFLSCGDAKRLPAVVKSIETRRFDDRVFYTLAGYTKHSATSVTTGKSILESEYCIDESRDYTGHQCRTVDGEMVTICSDWKGDWKDRVDVRTGETIKELEIGELFRMEANILKTFHCHRCGWEGTEKQLDRNERGDACPNCPIYRDVHASLSEI